MDCTRRLMRFNDDYLHLLEMQLESYAINFPGQELEELWFHHALETAGRSGCVWVYEQSARIIGWLWLDKKSLGVLHISHIQVDRRYWGCGLGRQMMRDAIQLALDEGRTSITLNVTKSNVRAIALYSALGFQPDQDNGERQLMRLRLAGDMQTGPDAS